MSALSRVSSTYILLVCLSVCELHCPKTRCEDSGEDQKQYLSRQERLYYCFSPPSWAHVQWRLGQIGTHFQSVWQPCDPWEFLSWHLSSSAACEGHGQTWLPSLISLAYVMSQDQYKLKSKSHSMKADFPPLRSCAPFPTCSLTHTHTQHTGMHALSFLFLVFSKTNTFHRRKRRGGRSLPFPSFPPYNF